MGWLSQSLESSIGKKFVMGFTGILLIIYLIVHLAGNLFLYAGDGGASFNLYADTLRSVPFLMVIELLLGLVFFFHILNGVRLWIINRKARPVNYKVNKPSEGSSWFSRTMIHTGSIIFIFLVIHLRSFWWPAFIGDHSETLFVKVVNAFSDPIYAGFYIVAMILLGFHLNHGFQSAFQTFGLNHKKYFPFIQKLGTLYAIVISLGFASMPVYFLFFYGGN